MLFMRPGIPSPGLVSRAYHQQNPYTFVFVFNFLIVKLFNNVIYL